MRRLRKWWWREQFSVTWGGHWSMINGDFCVSTLQIWSIRYLEMVWWKKIICTWDWKLVGGYNNATSPRVDCLRLNYPSTIFLRGSKILCRITKQEANWLIFFRWWRWWWRWSGNDLTRDLDAAALPLISPGEKIQTLDEKYFSRIIITPPGTNGPHPHRWKTFVLFFWQTPVDLKIKNESHN